LCTFDEFIAAYESSTLLALTDIKGVCWRLESLDLEALEDILSGPPTKSVWHLKQFVMEEEVELIPSVAVDYVFINCKDEEDTLNLKRLYKQILEMPKVKPPELHQAAIKGELFRYAGRLVQLKKKKKFQCLLKNPYPLLDI